MHRFAIVTDRADRFADLNDVINEMPEKPIVSWYETGAAALSSAANTSQDLVVVDEETAGMSVPIFLRELMAADANINTAVASSKALVDFHETYEGLGVLMQLPAVPDRSSAKKLIQQLRIITG